MTRIDPYVEPFTDAERAVVLRAQLSFSCFLEDVFARSYDGLSFRMSDRRQLPFSLGDVHHSWALLAQTYNRVCVLAPRMHLKSTILNHAFVFCVSSAAGAMSTPWSSVTRINWRANT